VPTTPDEPLDCQVERVLAEGRALLEQSRLLRVKSAALRTRCRAIYDGHGNGDGPTAQNVQTSTGAMVERKRLANEAVGWLRIPPADS
jgi:hypothetical protein